MNKIQLTWNKKKKKEENKDKEDEETMDSSIDKILKLERIFIKKIRISFII